MLCLPAAYPVIFIVSCKFSWFGRYLVSMGADLNAKTDVGGTALWLARKYNTADVVDFLEEIGALDEGDEL